MITAEEESEDDKGWMHEKKEKYKIHDILNTSLTALSYLAFGGYLVCMIVNTLREKKRRFMMTYPTATGTGNNQVSSYYLYKSTISEHYKVNFHICFVIFNTQVIALYCKW